MQIFHSSPALIRMASLPVLLDTINHNIHICLGIIELTIGNIGNLLVVFLFTQYPFSSTRASFVLIIIALSATIYLDLALILRLLAAIRRQTDTTLGSDVLCRFFMFVLNTCVLVFLNLLVLISIDRYLSSCHQVSRRAWSTKKVMYISSLLILIGSSLINCAYLSYSKNIVIDPKTKQTFCSISHSALRQFYVYFQIPVLFTFLPLIILIVSNALTIKNVRTLQQHTDGLEQQMTHILVRQTTICVICLLPFCLHTLYILATESVIKSTSRISIERLIGTIILHLFYVLLCSNFYIYAWGSTSIRQRVLLWIGCRNRLANQIKPASYILEGFNRSKL